MERIRWLIKMADATVICFYFRAGNLNRNLAKSLKPERDRWSRSRKPLSFEMFMSEQPRRCRGDDPHGPQHPKIDHKNIEKLTKKWRHMKSGGVWYGSWFMTSVYLKRKKGRGMIKQKRSDSSAFFHPEYSCLYEKILGEKGHRHPIPLSVHVIRIDKYNSLKSNAAFQLCTFLSHLGQTIT